ncbi:MAG: TVP38/TMEM64 family protein [Deltaproteobacteria bacterium]|nr:TVP38/TMEM64 family protein [Deltaproteobacteria bacterium]
MRLAKSLWQSASHQKIFYYIVAGTTLLITVVVLGDEVHRHIRVFEEWIEGMGPWAPVFFVLFYALLNSIFFPDTLLGIVAGVTFGFTEGLAVVTGGSLAGAVLQYLLSRHLLRPVIDRLLRAKPTLAAMQTAVLEQEFKLQLLIRLTPLNRALTSYVLGAAGVGFSRFVGACVAILPNLCLEVYFGIAGKHLAKVSGRHDPAALLHAVVMAVGLGIGITVMVLVSRAARRAVEIATKS